MPPRRQLHDGSLRIVSTEARADPRVGAVIGGRYRIERRLGVGSTGPTYAGVDLEGGGLVAVKVLLPVFPHESAAVQGFAARCHELAALGHPNIVAPTEIGCCGEGEAFVVSELVPGTSWAATMAETGPQPLDSVARIGRQLCSALGAAHAAGIVHLGLRPECVMLSKQEGGREVVRLRGFCVACLKESPADGQGGLSITGTMVWAPHCMAPEQIEGAPDLGPAVDIYGLGVLVHQALAGRPPFQADNLPMLLVQISREDPPPLRLYRPDLPEQIERLVAGMLAKKPEERPSSCREVAAELEPFSQG